VNKGRIALKILHSSSRKLVIAVYRTRLPEMNSKERELHKHTINFYIKGAGGDLLACWGLTGICILVVIRAGASASCFSFN
jgi:hypothetical protein